MFSRYLTGALVAVFFGIAPASAQTLAMHISSPALTAIEKALSPPPAHLRHKRATKKHHAALNHKRKHLRTHPHHRNRPMHPAALHPAAVRLADGG